MSVTVLSHPACNRHNIGDDHPENPARLYAISDQILSSGLEFVIHQRDAKLATIEQLALAHDRAYIQSVLSKNPVAGQIWLDDDTAIMNKSLEAALYAAGAGIFAVDLVMQGQDEQVFCATRPPGHHAEAAQAMGFCVFNNIAIAAKYALEVHKLQRVVIIDFDVHHGNGTEQIFKHDNRVLFCSSFEHPFYPFTDASSVPLCLKMPLAAGSNGNVFRQGFSADWLPAIQAFKPELILVSAGFDAHQEDDMAHLQWHENDYAWIGNELKQLAQECCAGRIVACLEGGYAHSALGRSVVALLKTWI